MQNEKIALIALIIIIAGALSIFFIATYQEDIFNNLFPSDTSPTSSDTVVADGDCIDIQYIGRYATNNTIFDTSYEDVDMKVKGDPLQVFVTLNESKTPPSDYIANYSSAIIQGLMEQLIGLEFGETYTLQIPANKAYGEKKLTVGSQFQSSTFAINSIKPSLSLNQTLQVTKITDEVISLKWIDIDMNSPFTMPQIILGNLSSAVQDEMILIPPPYYIWENASEIQSIEDDYIVVQTTPTQLESITETIEQINYGLGENDIYMIFPDATTASYTDTTITLLSEPELNASYTYQLNYFGQVINILYTVKSITTDTINISITYEGTNESQFILVNKTLSFDRIYNMKTTYDNIPMMYTDSLIGPDIQREGYSINKLAGEDLIFEVFIENIIKTSTQTDS